jgi:hypothetical protein
MNCVLQSFARALKGAPETGVVSAATSKAGLFQILDSRFWISNPGFATQNLKSYGIGMMAVTESEKGLSSVSEYTEVTQ